MVTMDITRFVYLDFILTCGCEYKRLFTTYNTQQQVNYIMILYMVYIRLLGNKYVFTRFLREINSSGFYCIYIII